MVRNQADRTKTLLVGIQAMWGSVEWILPVCKHLQVTAPEIKIIVLIMRRRKDEIFGDNRFLAELTRETVGGNCFDLLDLCPAYIKRTADLLQRLAGATHLSLFRTIDKAILTLYWRKRGKHRVRLYLDAIQADICLMDSPRNDFFPELKKRGVTIGFYLTFPSFSFSPEVWVDRQKLGSLYAGYSFDFFLADTDWTREFFLQINGRAKVFKVGTPKFDTEWLNYLLLKSDCSCEVRLQQDTKQILVLLKNESAAIFKEVGFEDNLRQILDVSLRCTDVTVVLKPHARQDMKLVRRIIDEFPAAKGRVRLSVAPLIALLDKSSGIIAMPSGIILDALVLNRQVIEYFDFRALNRKLRGLFGYIPKNSFGGMGCLDSEGNLTSVFRKRGLVVSADNREELYDRLNHQLSRTAHVNTDIRSLFPDHASRSTAEAIREMMSQESVG